MASIGATFSDTAASTTDDIGLRCWAGWRLRQAGAIALRRAGRAREQSRGSMRCESGAGCGFLAVVRSRPRGSFGCLNRRRAGRFKPSHGLSLGEIFAPMAVCVAGVLMLALLRHCAQCGSSRAIPRPASRPSLAITPSLGRNVWTSSPKHSPAPPSSWRSCCPPSRGRCRTMRSCSSMACTSRRPAGRAARPSRASST